MTGLPVVGTGGDDAVASWISLYARLSNFKITVYD